MGVTAENLAEKMSITREEQDAFAVESHRRAKAAQDAGRFDDQIVPVPVRVKRETVDFTRDEHIRPDADAGDDGEAADDLQEGRRDRDRRQRVGHERRRRGARADGRRSRAQSSARRCARGSSATRRAASTRRSWASARCRRCARCSTRAGVSLDEVGVIELNEAFAAQALAVMKDLELDPERT